jgi:hypothetical protein
VFKAVTTGADGAVAIGSLSASIRLPFEGLDAVVAVDEDRFVGVGPIAGPLDGRGLAVVRAHDGAGLVADQGAVPAALDVPAIATRHDVVFRHTSRFVLAIGKRIE